MTDKEKEYRTERMVRAMVASWADDRVVNNVMLVLIGEQGAYKTTWFSHLLPPVLRQYFYEKMILIFLGEDFFGFYYFYNKVRAKTQNEWENADFYLSVSELFRNYVAVKFKNYRAYEAYGTLYSAAFGRKSVPN